MYATAPKQSFDRNPRRALHVCNLPARRDKQQRQIQRHTLPYMYVFNDKREGNNTCIVTNAIFSAARVLQTREAMLLQKY